MTTRSTSLVIGAIRAYDAAALRRVVGQVGDLCALPGHESPGDGRGGVWVWDSTSTAPDDDDLILAPLDSNGDPLSRGRWRKVAIEGGGGDAVDADSIGLRKYTDEAGADLQALADFNDAILDAEIAVREAAGLSWTLALGAGAYPISGIVYHGAGEAFSIVGQGGGLILAGGSALMYVGPLTDAKFIEIGGCWRGKLEGFDIQRRELCGDAIWFHSEQPDGGPGLQGYEVADVGIDDGNPDAKSTIFGPRASTAVSANTLTDAGAGLTAGAFGGYGYRLVDSAGAEWEITDNDATSFTLDAGGASPAAGSYRVVDRPACVRFGHRNGGTYQCDLLSLEDVEMVGNSNEPEKCLGLKVMQGGNTKNFRITGGSCQGIRNGYDFTHGSGTVHAQGVQMSNVSDGDDGQDAGCFVFSEAISGLIETISVEQSPGQVARFINSPGLGSAPGNGIQVVGCVTAMTDVGGSAPGLGSIVENSVIVYPGPVELRGNHFIGTQGNSETYSPSITCGGIRLDQEAGGGVPAGMTVSMLNEYGVRAFGDYAPLYDIQGNPLTGTSGPTYLGYYRSSVLSFGDYGKRYDGGNVYSVPLEPWIGTQLRGGPLQNQAWDPAAAPILTGGFSKIDVAWNIAGQLALGDMIEVSFDQILPPGVALLEPQVIDDAGTKKIRVTIINVSGSTITSGAASPTTIPSGTLHLTYVRKVYT